MRPGRIARDAAVAAIALGVAVLLQVTVAVDLRALGGSPDLLAIAVVAIGVLRGPEAAALAGFGAGFLFDALSGQPLGLSSFVYSALGYAEGRFGETLRRRQRAAVRPLLAVAAGTMLARAGTLLLSYLLGANVAASDVFAPGAATSAAIDVLLAIPLYPALRALLPVARPVATPPAASPEQHVSPLVV